MENLKITYQMKQGKHSTAESYIELPIDLAKYKDKAKRNAKVKKALVAIANLQGYSLTHFQVDNEFEWEE